MFSLACSRLLNESLHQLASGLFVIRHEKSRHWPAGYTTRSHTTSIAGSLTSCCNWEWPEGRCPNGELNDLASHHLEYWNVWSDWIECRRQSAGWINRCDEAYRAWTTYKEMVSQSTSGTRINYMPVIVLRPLQTPNYQIYIVRNEIHLASVQFWHVTKIARPWSITTRLLYSSWGEVRRNLFKARHGSDK